jgi:hypothetical protein
MRRKLKLPSHFCLCRQQSPLRTGSSPSLSGGEPPFGEVCGGERQSRGCLRSVTAGLSEECSLAMVSCSKKLLHDNIFEAAKFRGFSGGSSSDRMFRDMRQQ